MASVRLATREARRKLLVRDKPYFLELRRGLALGYRRGTEGGSWLLREFRGGRYVQRRLGAADDDIPADGVAVLSWDDAQKASLVAERPTVSKPSRLTLNEAAETYFGTRSGDIKHDQWLYRATMEAPLGAKSVADLTTGDVERWLSQQAVVSKHEAGVDERETRRAAQATANRRWTLLRAILNSAYRKDPARVPSADAWRRVRAFQRVDKPRSRFLSAVEAKALLANIKPRFAALVRGALYTGCRLGELLRLTVAEVSKDAVSIANAKGGQHRIIPLSGEGARFFKALTKDQESAALAFGLPDTGALRVGLTRAMSAACEAAEIEPATFHDLRRSYGSLMLNSGASGAEVQRLLGHADQRMTLRVYAHLLEPTLRAAVNAHAPRLGNPTMKSKRPASTR
jgi:integrase